jgi:predicted histone-like DNA-binding protein
MINITIKQKVNPRELLEPRKYFGIAKASGVVDIRQLANQISKETTLGTPDVIAVIEALLQDIPEFLLDGKIVKLGDFGSYRLTVSGQGAENPDDYSVNLIEKTNLHFRGGKVFKDVLSRAVFSKVS